MLKKHCVYKHTSHGWDNFKHEIIYNDLSQEKALQKEKGINNLL